MMDRDQIRTTLRLALELLMTRSPKVLAKQATWLRHTHIRWCLNHIDALCGGDGAREPTRDLEERA
jgi:hypothetical protein